MSKFNAVDIAGGITLHYFGSFVTKVIKNGVVIWPVEPHTTGMENRLTPEQLNELHAHKRADAEAKELHLKEHARQQRANDSMVGGNHYKDPSAVGKCPHCRKEVQHWDWAHNLRALEYAATKYLARWRTKGGLESLKKVIHYTQKLIEIHFPEVDVSVRYSNRTDKEQRQDSGERGKEQSYAKDVAELRRKEVGAGEGVAPGTSSHQTAIDREVDSWGPSS